VEGGTHEEKKDSHVVTINGKCPEGNNIYSDFDFFFGFLLCFHNVSYH
jgi:hypothetical protein